MQLEMPEAPEGDCLNFDAYTYESGTECDGIWEAWDNWCWDDRVDWETYDANCQPVEDNLNKAYADSLNAKRPEGECLTWEAWYYESSNTVCNDTWILWDEACMYWYDEECAEVDADMQALPDLLVNLAKAGEPTTNSMTSFGADFAKGASFGAIAALGAMFVMRKCCNKTQERGDFHRV